MERVKNLFIIIVFVLYSWLANAQKKPLDFTVPETWPQVKQPSISNDGKYFMYFIHENRTGPKLEVQAVDNSKKEEIRGVDFAEFTADSRKVICRMGKDSLAALNLVDGKLVIIGDIKSYKSPNDHVGQWIVYLTPKNELIALNLSTGKRNNYSGVTDYELSNDGLHLIFTTNRTGKGSATSIFWVDLNDGKALNIANGDKFNRVVFDENNSGCAFLDWRQDTVNAIRYYKKGMDSSKVIANNETSGMRDLLLVDRTLQFSTEGDKLFFYIGKRERKANKKPTVVDYCYHDETGKLKNNKGPFLSVIQTLHPVKVIRIQQGNDNGYLSFSMGNDQRYVCLASDIIKGEFREEDWSVAARPDIYLVSTNDGSRNLIRKRFEGGAYFSTSGKYVLLYDSHDGQYYSYNILSKIIKNISKNINRDGRVAYNIIGWLGDDKGLLISDYYDIWLLEPDGLKAPFNLTHGYGRKNNICFSYLDMDYEHPKPIGDTLLLTASNSNNKDNGFYKLLLGRHPQLKRLFMASKMVYRQISTDLEGASKPMLPIKAKTRPLYLVTIMSVNEYPNFYLTTDFGSFKRLTDMAPQDSYKWFKDELVHWKTFDKKNAEGLLYKPEGFNPTKKYPAIVYIYQKNADGLNLFINPEWNDGPLNIPWYVSHDYLVFVPDIDYVEGMPGDSVYNTVVSGVKHLRQKPWVDGRQIGLQGHSYGGWETNYLVCHTNLFAAAAPASGTSDMLSDYGRFLAGESNHGYYEHGQGRLGATLWQNPSRYIENSPVFHADRVTTPLLIMHGKMDDYAVPFSQAGEWYSNLRRLNKKVWFLSYQNEGHVLMDHEDQKDYSIRLSQFFDYYLKGLPAPKWMTEGGTSLELDTSGKQP